jgi:hypothetical protein
MNSALERQAALTVRLLNIAAAVGTGLVVGVLLGWRF